MTTRKRLESSQDSPRRRYSQAITAARDAIAVRARWAAQLDLDSGREPAEGIEVLRAALHVEIDHLLDAEALKHPDPHRVIFRCPSYVELHQAVQEGM